MKPKTDEEVILWNFQRDLCVCTEGELRSRWDGEAKAALAKCGVDLEKRIAGHNPIYFIAEELFFENKREAEDEREFLYVPLHKDVLCKGALEYILTPPEERKAGLIIVLSRDTFKSVFNHGVIPWFFALRFKHLQGKDARICLTHHKEQQASADLARMREKVRHPFIRKFWPEFYYHDPLKLGTMTAFDFPCKELGRQQEPSVYAVGVGGGMTGWHFDLMAPDDNVTEEHIRSRAVREQAKLKYETSRFMLDAKGCEIYTDTPYHVNDLTKKLVDANVEGVPIYERIVRGGIGDDGVLLHPYRLSREVLEKKRQQEIARRGTDLLWQLQYQCSWKSDKLTVADESWFRFMRPDEISPKSWRVLFIDPAWKGDKNWGSGCDAGFSVIQFERRTNTLYRILLDGSASNEMSLSDGVREAIRLGRKWGLSDFYAHETGGYGYTQTLKQEGANKGWPMEPLDLHARSVQRAQPQRIGTLMRQMEMGRFWINSALKGTEYLEKFKIQTLDWPQAEPDDAIDSAALSCLEEVVENYAPLPARRWMEKKEPPPQYRTRYCAN